MNYKNQLRNLTSDNQGALEFVFDKKISKHSEQTKVIEFLVECEFPVICCGTIYSVNADIYNEATVIEELHWMKK